MRLYALQEDLKVNVLLSVLKGESWNTLERLSELYWIPLGQICHVRQKSKHARTSVLASA